MRTDPSASSMLLDIEKELAYWELALPDSEFRSVSLSFEHYIPTIKFGYDCYLLYHASPLSEILPALRARYSAQVPSHQQLDWRWADQIIRHAWGRMRAA